MPKLIDLGDQVRPVDAERPGDLVRPVRRCSPAASTQDIHGCTLSQSARAIALTPATVASLHEEQRVEHDRFGERDGQNRLDQIGVAAPGLRPTASDAFMPMMPTARAAPRAARPTCRLPVIVFVLPVMRRAPARIGRAPCLVQPCAAAAPPS